MEIKNFPVDPLLAKKKSGKIIRNVTTFKCSSRLSLIIPVKNPAKRTKNRRRKLLLLLCFRTHVYNYSFVILVMESVFLKWNKKN